MSQNYMLVPSDGLSPLLNHLESRLSKRTYVSPFNTHASTEQRSLDMPCMQIVGHRASLADVAIWTLLSDLQFKEEENPNLFRWQRSFSSIPALGTLIGQAKDSE